MRARQGCAALPMGNAPRQTGRDGPHARRAGGPAGRAPAGGGAADGEGLRLAARAKGHIFAPVQLLPGACAHARAASSCSAARRPRAQARLPAPPAAARAGLQPRGGGRPARTGGCGIGVGGQALERPVARVALRRVAAGRQRVGQHARGRRARRQPVLQPRRAAAGRAKVQPLGGRVAVEGLRAARAVAGRGAAGRRSSLSPRAVPSTASGRRSQACRPQAAPLALDQSAPLRRSRPARSRPRRGRSRYSAARRHPRSQRARRPGRAGSASAAPPRARSPHPPRAPRPTLLSPSGGLPRDSPAPRSGRAGAAQE